MAKQVGYLCDISVTALNAEDITKGLAALSNHVAITGFKVTAHPKERVVGCIRVAQYFNTVTFGPEKVIEPPRTLVEAANVEGNINEGDNVELGINKKEVSDEANDTEFDLNSSETNIDKEDSEDD